MESGYSLRAGLGTAHGVGGEKFFVSRVSRRLAVAVAVVCVAVGVVSVASAAPQPGTRCKVAGRERVTSAGTLRCTASSGRSLRWVQVAPPPTTTTTTTSSTTTTVAASARAPQVSAISTNETRLQFTLSGMSPDTGNYAVQWVDKGQSFNTYRMLRFTERTIAISTAEFACGGSTYTFRVFVMRADWQLADGHQRQNVTPHTEPFDVTFTHACPIPETTTTTAAPLSCAAGGTCAVGDTGPGGGTVFYVHPSGTFSCGIGLNSTCKYLEFAPYGWNGGGDDPGIDWCNVSTDLDIDESGIGGGLANTTEADNTCTSGAIQTVASYTNNSLGDWYLPSKSESNELCKYARQQTTGDSSVGCASSGSVRSGFRSMHYWTSTEVSGSTNAWSTEFGFGNQLSSNKVPGTLAVRPIRAFGGTTGCADGGTCAVGDTGPGGGIVFYVHSDADNMFTSTGSDCGTTCRYLEAAPVPSGGDVSRQWASNNDNRSTAVPAPGARATGIGSGMANSNAIQAQTGNVAASSAAVYTYDYSSFGKTDWYLPSLDELNELCKYARTQTTGDTSVECGSSGTLRTGFDSGYYWSSTEVSASSARIQYFDTGSRSINGSKALTTVVRPVRAFG